MRSTTAPRISAGVMIANIAWNMTKMYSGMLRGGAAVRVTESRSIPASPTFERSPMKACPAPKARL